MIFLSVVGTPVAQPRPRFTTVGKGVRAYVPTKHPVHEWRAKVIAEAMDTDMQGYNNGRPLRIVLNFGMPRPVSQCKKAGGLRKGAPLWHVQKPDLDNLAKPVMDALVQAGLFNDDSYVTDLTVTKDWVSPGDNGGVLITIEALA